MKTINFYIQEISKLTNEYIPISIEKRNGRNVLRIKHLNCNNEFLMSFSDFKRGRRCPICFGTHKKTQEEFENEVKKLVGDEYSVIGKYVNSDTPILMKHNTCGKEFLVVPHIFVSNGTRCPICFGTHKKTQEEFENEVKKLVGDEYSVIGKYVNSATKVRFLHNTCQHEFDMKPTNFISNGQRCPHCNSNFGKITIDLVREEFRKEGLELLSKKYKNSKEKLQYKCLKCGNIHSVSYASFKSKRTRCPYCSKNKKLSFSDIKMNIENRGEFTVLSLEKDFKNVHSKLRIKHKCGFIFRNSYNNFRNGQRCPICENKKMCAGLSKNVRKIINYFLKNNISFEREYSFDDLTGEKGKLRIDFYLPDYQLYLEYNGKQHYGFVEGSKIFTEEQYKRTLENDNKKMVYMKNHNLNFEIIKYNENTIDTLEKILLKYKKI